LDPAALKGWKLILWVKMKNKTWQATGGRGQGFKIEIIQI
jgi:hypothetical protein